MTDTILIGIDGSKAGEHAVNFAVSQAKSANTSLVLAYVVEWSPYTFNTPEENEQRHLRRKEEIKTARERVLNPILTSLESQKHQGSRRCPPWSSGRCFAPNRQGAGCRANCCRQGRPFGDQILTFWKCCRKVDPACPHPGNHRPIATT